MEVWEREFSEWCNEKFLVNKKTSPVVLQDYVEKVVAFLKDGVYPPGLDARQKSNFKFKVTKDRKYSWCTIPAIGNLDHETVLTVPGKDGNGTLIVIPLEKFFPTLVSLHEHSGHAKTYTMWQQQFAEKDCERALHLLRGVIHLDALRYMALELEHFLPTFTVEKRSVYAAFNLLEYGSGYMKFIPPQVRTTHEVYNVSDLYNQCLFNSVSLMIYGDENHSSLLKLTSVLKGILEKNRIISEVLQTVRTSDEAIAWAAGFASEEAVDALGGDPKDMVSQIVERELLSGLDDNDSGPVQIMAMACLLNRQIEILCTEENSPPSMIYGPTGERVTLIRVPLNIDSVDGLLRYNHFVPAMPRTIDEESRFLTTCGASAYLDVCNCPSDAVGLEWVQCDDCSRWFHSMCLIDQARGHTMKRQPVLKCGCHRKGPYTTNRNPFLTDVKVINRILREQRPFLKDSLIGIANKNIPSWRANSYRPNNNQDLIMVSGLACPIETVTFKLKQFIAQQLPGPVSPSFADYVLFPELLIRLFISCWGINRVEAEYYIREK